MAGVRCSQLGGKAGEDAERSRVDSLARKRVIFGSEIRNRIK